MMEKIGKYKSDLISHNIVLSNYEGKSGHSWGALQVNVAIGSSVRPTLFSVVESKANYNLLLDREWIHGVGAVPSTLHQKLLFWRDDGVVEYIEADQSYFLSEQNTITKQTFDKNLAMIAPCGDKDSAFDRAVSENVYHSVTLHPTHGFCWEREEIDNEPPEYGAIPLSGWMMTTIMMTEPLPWAKISAYIAENKLEAALEAASLQNNMAVEANEV
jgi:hypothetical protein